MVTTTIILGSFVVSVILLVCLLLMYCIIKVSVSPKPGSNSLDSYIKRVEKDKVSKGPSYTHRPSSWLSVMPNLGTGSRTGILSSLESSGVDDVSFHSSIRNLEMRIARLEDSSNISSVDPRIEIMPAVSESSSRGVKFAFAKNFSKSHIGI